MDTTIENNSSQTEYYNPNVEPANLFVVEIIDGKVASAESISLECRNSWIIGRGEASSGVDISLSLGAVSRNHGKLEYAEYRWRYTDGVDGKASTNGTIYNGKTGLSGEKVELSDGDTLRIDGK